MLRFWERFENPAEMSLPAGFFHALTETLAKAAGHYPPAKRLIQRPRPVGFVNYLFEDRASEKVSGRGANLC